ncbi:glycosyltransferase involved in cell wall biosynthesis [Bradyrhizobium sp. LB7.2]
MNEALSYGCPAIVSHRCGCTPELISEGTTGFAFQWGDIGQLAEKMNAVTEVFSDVVATARACLDRIAPYNPDAAAKAILEGCRILHRKTQN